MSKNKKLLQKPKDKEFSKNKPMLLNKPDWPKSIELQRSTDWQKKHVLQKNTDKPKKQDMLRNIVLRKKLD